MSSRIDNLNDYGKVTKLLKSAGGSLDALLKKHADTAVAKATPKLMVKGGVIMAIGLGVAFAGYKGYLFMKDRKQKIENEPALKQELIDAMEEELLKIASEENDDCDDALDSTLDEPSTNS